MSTFNNTIPSVITSGRSGFRPATTGNRSNERLSVDQLVTKLTAKYRELEERTAELEKERTRRRNAWERDTIGRNPEQSVRNIYN